MLLLLLLLGGERFISFSNSKLSRVKRVAAIVSKTAATRQRRTFISSLRFVRSFVYINYIALCSIVRVRRTQALYNSIAKLFVWNRIRCCCCGSRLLYLYCFRFIIFNFHFFLRLPLPTYIFVKHILLGMEKNYQITTQTNENHSLQSEFQ